MNYASTDSLCKGDLRGDDDKCKAQETDKSEWDKYVEEYTKELEDFLEDDDIKQSDYFYYGKAATLGPLNLIHFCLLLLFHHFFRKE